MVASAGKDNRKPRRERCCPLGERETDILRCEPDHKRYS